MWKNNLRIKYLQTSFRDLETICEKIRLQSGNIMAPERNVNANNLVQTNSPTSAFQGTVNSILTASNQEQSINIVNAEANQINRNGLLLVLATAPVV